VARDPHRAGVHAAGWPRNHRVRDRHLRRHRDRALPFEHGLGRGRLYAFGAAGLLRIRPVQDGDFTSLYTYGPTDPAGTNTGFCAAIGAGLRWPFEIFPHTLLRLEGEYLTRSNARYFGNPPYVSDGAGGSMANLVRGRADLASVHFGVLIQP